LKTRFIKGITKRSILFRSQPALLEATIREDTQITRFLRNNNFRYAAEGAIQFFCRGIQCDNPKWPTTSTWYQVKSVYDRLLEN
jgi:hypothetical protein